MSDTAKEVSDGAVMCRAGEARVAKDFLDAGAQISARYSIFLQPLRS